MADTVILSGLGGETIINILANHINKAKTLKRLIIQANTKTPLVRTFLNKNGFAIIDEKIIEDRGKIYEVISAAYSPGSGLLTKEECYFGPILRKKKTAIFLKKYRNRRLHLKKVLESLKVSPRYFELRHELLLIEKEILNESIHNS